MAARHHIIETDKLQKLRFYGDEFVFNTVSGLCYRLNPTAGFLLHSLVDGMENTELVDMIQKRYNIDRKAAMRDVELLLNDLCELGVLD